MILIWSGEGGPLQWLGLIIFILQFFAPNFIQLTIDLQNIDGGIPPTALVLIGSVVFVFLLSAIYIIWQVCQNDEEEIDENGTDTATANDAPSAQADGTRANPVVIDDDEDDDTFFTRAAQRVNSILHSVSPTHLILAIGFLLPFAMTAPLLIDGMQEGLAGIVTNPGVVQMTTIALIAHSMMAIAAYKVLRDVLDSGGVGPYPGTRQGRRRRARKLTVSEIADIVRKVKVEEFVSQEDVKNGECSISRMKRMLANRGAADAAENCVERDDLVQELEKVRKYNEECAICAEEYVEG